MLSVFIPRNAFLVCQELAIIIAKNGKEFGLPPDMTGILKGNNNTRAAVLNTLVKKGILKERTANQRSWYAFLVPIKQIREGKGYQPGIDDGEETTPTGYRKELLQEALVKKEDIPLLLPPVPILKKPPFSLVTQFMSDVNKRSAVLNEQRNDVLLKRIAEIKTELLTIPNMNTDEEYDLIQRLATLSKEQRNAGVVVLTETIQDVTRDEAYNGYDFRWISTDVKDYDAI
jgi:hypothetical protein